jgi:CubicO group peptidase (beta-lactamase class C family)
MATRRLGFAAVSILFTLLPALTAGAQSLTIAEPESVGMSSERLARIGPAMQAYIDRGEVAGTVTMVARRGRVVYLEARGFADLETERPLTTDSLFRLASQTKPVTAAAAMILFERGQFRLDDPISRYLPEYGEMQVAVPTGGGEYDLVPAERPITIRHLLTHTAGMSGGPDREVEQKIVQIYRRMPRPQDATLADLVTQYAQMPLGFQPGEAWQYSPITGINVVGRLVEVLSGQTLAEFDHEHIFEPLGMDDTFYYVPPPKLDRFTVGYRRMPDGTIRPSDPADGRSRFANVDRPQVMFAGAYGLVSTVHDYLRFAQMLLNGGELDGVRILGRKTVELIRSPHAGDVPKVGGLAGRGTQFGLGVNVVVDQAATGGLLSKGTFNWGGAFGTTFWIDPAEELIGLYMMQLQNHRRLRIRGEFQTLTYAAITD